MAPKLVTQKLADLCPDLAVGIAVNSPRRGIVVGDLVSLDHHAGKPSVRQVHEAENSIQEFGNVVV